MRLARVRIQKYRSIRDTGWFEVEPRKTILVGPNEAGKTAILQALQQINAPKGLRGFDPLRDYPRSEFNDITTGKVKPEEVTVVEGEFVLDADDAASLELEFRECTYTHGRRLDNSDWHRLNGGPDVPTYGALTKDLLRLAAHADSRVAVPEGADKPSLPSAGLAAITEKLNENVVVRGAPAKSLEAWLDKALPLIDENNKVEEARFEDLKRSIAVAQRRDEALQVLEKRMPVFVLFSNYFRVRPLIHLEHLAHRIEANVLDDDAYDYGNKCLLQLLGFSARELSNLGKAAEPALGNADAFKAYKDQLDKRAYQLNAASVRLTDEIRHVWVPDPKRAEAERLRLTADAQYLKVVVEDDLGVEIELDQRSEGFQWLVSFFIVFFCRDCWQARECDSTSRRAWPQSSRTEAA